MILSASVLGDYILKEEKVIADSGWKNKSNPTVFEWCASPIVYLEREEFSDLKKLLPQYEIILYRESIWHLISEDYHRKRSPDVIK